MLNKIFVQNANLDIMWLQIIVDIAVLNVLYQIVLNARIVLDIVEHVFMDMLFIFLKRYVKFQ